MKPPTPVLLTMHFSATMKIPVFGNLFKLFRLAITFAREVCHLGIKMMKNMTIVSFFSLSSKANCPCECDAKLKSLNKLPRRRVSLQVKNRWLEELEMVALFLLKTGTFSAKNW